VSLRVRVDDAAAARDLKQYLTGQGFRAEETSCAAELEVLFPGQPSIFAPAVELDLWRSRHAGVNVTIVSDRTLR
jgi:hypothetical protein